MSALEYITHEAEKLDPHSQFLLAERLVSKLGQTAEHRAAWSEESRNRADAFDRGEIDAVDANEAFQSLRTLIGKK